MQVEIADGVTMTFCWIPPGNATLGSPESASGRDENEAECEYASEGDWLGKYPVTQEQWTAVMKTTPFAFHEDGDYQADVKGLDTSRLPAERVSWDDICGEAGRADGGTFLGKVNARRGAAAEFGGAGRFKLPHEDEWESGRNSGFTAAGMTGARRGAAECTRRRCDCQPASGRTGLNALSPRRMPNRCCLTLTVLRLLPIL